jgi:threonyl-tRNA synthetase
MKQIQKATETYVKNMPKHRFTMNRKSYRMAHPIYNTHEIEKISMQHHEPEGIRDKLMLKTVKGVRKAFDTITQYDRKETTERTWLNRCIFLETIAGVPGMVGGMSRHMRSLRTLERDNGWIHHMLEEAENERMHLFIFLKIRNPGIMMRLAIAIS